ncbi:MAG: YcxB family protein [Oscillospiraceae bacterium]|nr:YcxB family protein [Oscillospiraceae bacterium]
MLFVNKTVNTRDLVYETFLFHYGRGRFLGWLARYLLFFGLYIWEIVAIFRTHSNLTIDLFAWFFLAMLMAVSPLRSRRKLWRKRSHAVTTEQMTTTFTFGEDGLHILDGLYGDTCVCPYAELEKLRETRRYLYLTTKWKRYILDKAGFQTGSAPELTAFLRQTMQKQVSTKGDRK